MKVKARGQHEVFGRQESYLRLGHYSLERGGVLSSANAPRRVDRADGTAGIAITTPMRHALCASERIEAVGGDGRHRYVASDSVRSPQGSPGERIGPGNIAGR